MRLFCSRELDADAASRLKEKMDERYRQKENTMKDYQPEEFAMLKECKVEQRCGLPTALKYQKEDKRHEA